MRYLFLCCAWLVCVTGSYGNSHKDINIRCLNIEDGLSQYIVNTIYQDEFGFIWIGTHDGLNRYNGSRIDIFKPDRNDPLSIRENNIRYVCGDNAGHLYIKGLESVSVYDMKSNAFTMILKNEVRAIQYRSGLLWIATANKISTYDPSSGDICDHFSFPEDEQKIVISTFCVNEYGELFISTVFHGFYIVGMENNITRHISMPEANSLTEDSDGNIWVASRSEGLYHISPAGTIMEHYMADSGNPSSLIHNNVRQVCEDNNGNLYVGTYDGLCYLDTSSGQFTEYRFAFQRINKNNRSILTMMRDNQGTLWMGTFYEGVKYYNTDNDIYKYYNVSTEEGGNLTSSVVSSMVEDSQNRLWIGTEGGGLNVYDPRKGTFRSLMQKDGLSSDVIKSLYYESEHNILWVGTLYHGINRIDLNTGNITRIQKRIHYKGNDIGYAQNIMKIVPSGDSLLLATNKGVVVFDKTNHTMSRMDLGVVVQRRAQVWDIAFDDQQCMWLTSSTELFRVGNGRLIKSYVFSDISGFDSKNYLSCLLKDSRGRMWLGSTGSGLFLYDSDTDTFENYDSSHGLNNNFITALIEKSGGGGIYVGTNSGLSMFDPEKKAFVNYGQNMGFPTTVINDNGLYLMSSGEMFVSGHNGLLSVKASDIKHIPHESKAYITDISVNNRAVNPSDPENGLLTASLLYQKSVKLRPKHSVITFSFTATDYVNSGNTTMEYMLDGFDGDFVLAPAGNTATYTNLYPGKYTFRVRTHKSAADEEKAIAASLEVIVLPPFYATLWFAALCLAVILCVAYYIFRNYAQGVMLRSSLESEKREKEHIEQVNQSKLRFFTNVSHEFRTPLTLIDAQLEMLLEKRDMKPSVYSAILSVYKNSRRMHRLVDEVIDIRKQEQGFMKLRISRQDMVQYLREIYLSFNDFARNKGITYAFNSTAENIEAWFDTVQMEKVVCNLLSNAFKFTAKGGRIELSVCDSDETVIISVTDNGSGISPEHFSLIFERFYQDEAANEKLEKKGSGVGLALSKGIVELHGGTISVDSSTEEGTCFTVILRKEMNPDMPHVELAVNNSRERYISDLGMYAEPDDDQVTDNQTQEAPAMGRILIVEDNSDVRGILCRIFSPLYDVLEAHDGKMGIEIARKSSPDIIVSDIMMPVMSGVEMCRILKSDLATCHIPVVLLTARTADEHKIEGLQTGADDYITKPFNTRLLVARCNNLVAGRRRMQHKYMKEPDASVEMLSANPLDSALLRKAIRIVEENLDNSAFDIQMFCKEMGLSRTSLFSKIKGLTGETPNEFIFSIRLKKAVVMLISNPSATISEIAYDLGFNSLSYFIKCFKDAYGCSPRVYRKQNLGGTPAPPQEQNNL